MISVALSCFGSYLLSMAGNLDKSSDIIEGLKQDILWLLIVIYSYKERSRLEGASGWSREHFATELVLLESSVRDIVVRLTALDDDTKRNRSFQTLFKAMKREGLARIRTKDIKLKVGGFRKSVNKLKVSHRNNYIAHVGTNARVQPRVIDVQIDFAKPASEAVNLLDCFEGKPVEYFFRLGSDQKIDLRQALQEPPIG